MIVLDASAAVELLLNTSSGRRVAARIAGPDVSLHAPHLLSIEVAQVIRRYVAAGQVEAARGRDAVMDLAGIGLISYEHDLLLPRIWELRDNLTAYDAAYVALAELLDAPILTLDERLGGAPGHDAQVELLPGE